MRSTTSISTPKLPCPISASPETLSNIRRYFGVVVISPSRSDMTLPLREVRNLLEHRERRFRGGVKPPVVTSPLPENAFGIFDPPSRGGWKLIHASAAARHLRDFIG